MRILNLTQHVATPEQISQGVFEPANKAEVKLLLTFTAAEAADRDVIISRAFALAVEANSESPDEVMIGGMPALMAPLQEVLRRMGYAAVFAVTDRVSVETVNAEGITVKTSEFKHVGFTQAIFIHDEDLPESLSSKRVPRYRCTCGSGEPWQDCHGLDGDTSYCG